MEEFVEEQQQSSEDPETQEQKIEDPGTEERTSEDAESQEQTSDVTEAPEQVSGEPEAQEQEPDLTEAPEQVSEVTEAPEPMSGEPEAPEQRPEDLETLEQKRSIMNNDAEKHRRLRDDLNKQTKEWVAKRDALNAQVRALIDEAGKHRESRDEFNVKVRESKDLRDEWNKKVADLNEKVSALRKDREPMPERRADGDVPIKQLKKQLRDLEFTQQTKPLGKDKESEIVKQISLLARQIEEKEKVSEQGGEVKELVRQLRESKAQAETYHKAVSEHARSAQTAHDDMLALYDQADKLRKEADAAQEKFIECKTQADEEHRKHIEQIKSVHEMDKDVGAIKSRKAKDRRKKVDNESKKEAEEIFERFKAGEKLSTDDLMALQKSGYL